MFKFQGKVMLYLDIIQRISLPTPKLCNFPECNPSTFSFKYCTSTSDSQSFMVKYLINKCGFSSEMAFKASKRVQFDNSEKPDSVIAFFRNHGFSNSQIFGIFEREPTLLASNADKTILPKFEFLLSKGASSSDLVFIVTRNTAFLRRSLEKCIIPMYNSVNRFLQSDEWTIRSIKCCPSTITNKYVLQNVQTLLDNGVPESKVALLLRSWSYSFRLDPDVFKMVVEEVKALGLNPRATIFVVAVYAKCRLHKSVWQKKIDLYKKWGWSEQTILSTFAKYPWCMLASGDKIVSKMEFFVNHMGWDSGVLAKYPSVLLMSMEKRIIPRASVLQFLLSRGLIKNAKSASPFRVSEKKFLQKFVNCFKEEASQLLQLYEEKMNLSK